MNVILFDALCIIFFGGFIKCHADVEFFFKINELTTEEGNEVKNEFVGKRFDLPTCLLNFFWPFYL